MLVVGAIQMSMTDNSKKNIEKADSLVRKAYSLGARLILLPELFQNLYFCQEKKYENYELAKTYKDDEAVIHYTKLSKELNIVIPISFYERDGSELYNSVAFVDCGNLLGIYRKLHIPDDHFYQEKFYFREGNHGIGLFDTSLGKIGIGICWDQWFPLLANTLARNGAEVILYPTAIGSEPILNVDSSKHWMRVMKGHAASNIVPVIAANRIGVERVKPSVENNNQDSSLRFYGHSFMTDMLGKVVEELGETEEDVIIHSYDIEAIRKARLEWGLYRDYRMDFL